MGCDIHSNCERKDENGNWTNLQGFSPFNDRCYGTFGFLAGVRNYSAVKPIAERRGFPEDASDKVRKSYEGWSSDAHSASWLSVSELNSFNYDNTCEDRRCTQKVAAGYFDGGQTCDTGEGKTQTFREFLGPYFFKDLEKLNEIGAERIVFWFDN